VAVVVENGAFPVGVKTLARIGVIVEVRTVEIGQPVRIVGKCEGTQSKITPTPASCRASTRYM
jgi:hypothetical protein